MSIKNNKKCIDFSRYEEFQSYWKIAHRFGLIIEDLDVEIPYNVGIINEIRNFFELNKQNIDNNINMYGLFSGECTGGSWGQK